MVTSGSGELECPCGFPLPLPDLLSMSASQDPPLSSHTSPHQSWTITKIPCKQPAPPAPTLGMHVAIPLWPFPSLSPSLFLSLSLSPSLFLSLSLCPA